jgi:hypothetical protein
MTSSAGHFPDARALRPFFEWLLALGVSLATALLLIAPFFWLGNASGHDISFHVSSWMDVAGQWREGIVFPRWAEWANYGFGEPRFIFYPPLSWMLGAALSFVVPWKAVPGVFIVLIQSIAGLSFFAVARRFLPRRGALFGAACYAANPYALVIIYMRSDFAELLACTLMPLLVSAAMQLCGLLENRWRSQARATAVFAMVFAGVWLSNAPAGVMASYNVALVFLWTAIQEKSLVPLLRGAGGLALAFGLTSFYLLPAAYEQRWVNIAQALSSGLLPSQNFLYTLIADPEHNGFNWIASSVAILLIVLTGIAGLAARRRANREPETGESEKLWRVMMLLAASATILMIRVSSVFWTYLPKLRFVQFPWRWMAILAVPYAYFVAAALPRRRWGWVWGSTLVLVVGGTATYLVQKTWWDSEDIPVLQEALANDQGFEGTDEYDPLGDDHSNLPQKSPTVQILAADESQGITPKARIDIQRWTAEERIVAVLTNEPARVAVRILNYPAWRVELWNHETVSPLRLQEPGPMVIPIPAGLSEIRIRFVRTPDRTLGLAISVIAVLTLLALLNAGGSRLLSASP